MRLLFFKDLFCGVVSINTCSEKNSLNVPARKTHLLILPTDQMRAHRQEREEEGYGLVSK